ncbi:DNA polymerase III subunit delta [Henriciella sp. AS95]|uniref:DNA polymerase III subunit delta n=1 Tax=Henriciella sp. AS95 TaxID=3135782 RepID=UPI003174DD6A
MILKGGQVSSFARKPDSQTWCVLVFGDDDGVVSDTADQIIAGWAKRAGDSKTVTLDDDDIRREPHLLADNIEIASLLGELNIVRIRTSGEKIAKSILGLVEEADQRGESFANRLIIQCSGLNKRSKLRSGIEAANSAAAIHVFADTAQSLQDMVKARLAEFDVEIDTDALQDFVSLLPGHRGLANQEADKLALYGRGLGRPVSLNDVRLLCQTDADNSVRDMVQYALDGNGVSCLAEYDRISEIGTSAISILRIFEMEARRLLEARGLLGTGGDIGRKLRPPVWQSEWPAFRSRMDKWSAASLTRLLAAIHDLELKAKTEGPAAEAAIRVFLLNVIKSAAQRSRMTASP